jgi:hypothetical protein
MGRLLGTALAFLSALLPPSACVCDFVPCERPAVHDAQRNSTHCQTAQPSTTCKCHGHQARAKDTKPVRTQLALNSTSFEDDRCPSRHEHSPECLRFRTGDRIAIETASPIPNVIAHPPTFTTLDLTGCKAADHPDRMQWPSDSPLYIAQCSLLN